MFAMTKAKAVHGSKLLAFIVLRYGVDAARNLASFFARIFRRVLLSMQPAYQGFQRPTDLQQQVGTQ